MIFKYIIAFILLLIPIVNNANDNVVDVNYRYVGVEINKAFEVVETSFGPYTGSDNEKNEVIRSYYGPMTAYGPDCVGCIGITTSGYNVLDGKIFYNDEEFGNIRILAADRSLPFGTIIRITGLKDYPNGLLAIVLDRGSAIGFNKRSYFDLLYKSEYETLTFGCQYATFEILRMGYYCQVKY